MSRRICDWPDCLTATESEQLAQDVLDAELGLPVPVRPDKRRECGCTDPGLIDWDAPEVSS